MIIYKPFMKIKGICFRKYFLGLLSYLSITSLYLDHNISSNTMLYVFLYRLYICFVFNHIKSYKYISMKYSWYELFKMACTRRQASIIWCDTTDNIWSHRMNDYKYCVSVQDGTRKIHPNILALKKNTTK